MTALEFLGEGICDGCGQHVEQLVAIDGAPLAGGALCLQCSDEGYLLELAQVLDEAVPVASAVQISDTLARMIAARLREIAEARGEGYLLELAQVLDGADRLGAEVDVPEGVSWVQIPDRLAKQIAARLREIAAGIAEARKGGERGGEVEG